VISSLPLLLNHMIDYEPTFTPIINREIFSTVKHLESKLKKLFEQASVQGLVVNKIEVVPRSTQDRRVGKERFKTTNSSDHRTMNTLIPASPFDVSLCPSEPKPLSWIQFLCYGRETLLSQQ